MQVIWRSAACWVVHKPAGLATQAPPQYPSLESHLRQQIDGYLALPHRLDRPVGGCVLVALTKRAARLLGQQFEARKVVKQYLAWVSGEVVSGEVAGGVGGEVQVWRDSIRKIAGQAKAEVVPSEFADADPAAQEAITRVRVLRRGAAATLLLLQPETGRMHQLRLQCAQRGWPIIGDRLYGSPLPFACQRARAAVLESDRQPIALYAYRLQFADPVSGKATTVRAEPPWDGDYSVREAELLAEHRLV